MKFLAVFVTAMLACPATVLAGDLAFDKPDLYLSAGTLGAGIEADWRLDPNWGVRAGLHAGALSFVNRDFGSDLNNNVRLLNAGLTADYYIGGGSLRLSAGARLSANRITGRVTNLQDRIRMFGRTVVVTIPDPLTRYSVTQNPVQPYVGAGLNHDLTDRVSLSLDLGALYAGVPDINVTSRAGRLGFTDRQIRNEIERAQRRAEAYQFVPVVQIGLKFRF